MNRVIAVTLCTCVFVKAVFGHVFFFLILSLSISLYAHLLKSLPRCIVGLILLPSCKLSHVRHQCCAGVALKYPSSPLSRTHTHTSPTPHAVQRYTLGGKPSHLVVKSFKSSKKHKGTGQITNRCQVPWDLMNPIQREHMHPDTQCFRNDIFSHVFSNS